MKIQIASLILLFYYSTSCNSQINSEVNKKTPSVVEKTNKIHEFQQKYNDSLSQSISKGTVSNGSLIHGKLMPFQGKNYFYFDTSSYLSGRAFVNKKVKELCLDAYQELEKTVPNRSFGIMECSNEKGGKLEPHHTHQNGLSVDFMSPLKSHDTINTSLDKTGIQHYFIDFDEDARYTKDKQIYIDFDAMALHILKLNALASKHGLKINKVILKLNLKDNLYASKYGTELKSKGIYFAQKLPTIINNLHDDHYHIDFEEIK